MVFVLILCQKSLEVCRIIAIKCVAMYLQKVQPHIQKYRYMLHMFPGSIICSQTQRFLQKQIFLSVLLSIGQQYAAGHSLCAAFHIVSNYTTLYGTSSHTKVSSSNPQKYVARWQWVCSYVSSLIQLLKNLIEWVQ